MQKLLITGYTGFIGSNLTHDLSEKNLYGVDIIEKESVLKHFNWDNINDCTDCECIVHLAGKAHDINNNSDEKQYFDINVGLTKSIFKQFLESSAEKFIFFSSVKAVADIVLGDQLTEDAKPNPKTPYGRSKLAAEEYILNELDKWKKEEMAKGKDCEWKKVYILRPCMIHGPGNKGNLNMLFNFQQKGLPWPLGSFKNERSFCSIKNIVYVVRQIIDSPIDPGIYHVADDEVLSTIELIRLIAISQKKKPIIWNVPVKIINIIALLGDILHLPINNDSLKKLTESYSVSNRKLKYALGIKKMPVTAIEGFQYTLNSFRK